MKVVPHLGTQFESLTVEQLRQLELKTRSEIEEKKYELHQLIGNRYRDIIDASDSILDMKRDAEGLRLKLDNISKTCRNLKNVVDKRELTANHPDSQLNRKLYSFAKKIKKLVDTPEEIWYALETHNYLKATINYLIAKKRFSKLEKDNDHQSQKILKSISLLKRQWEKIEQFPKKILSSSQARLEIPGLTSKEYCGCLVAQVFLANRRPVQIFMDFLSGRKKAFSTILSQTDDPIKAIRELTLSIQFTLYHVGSLFLCYPFLDKDFEEDDEGEFERNDNLSDTGLFYVMLSRVIKQTNEGDDKNFVIVGEETIQSITSEWILSCTELITTSNILSHIHSVHHLHLLEDSILAQIQHPFQDTSLLPSPAPRKPSHPSPSTPSWSSICLQVLNKSFDIWESIFRLPILHRSKQIISESLESIPFLPDLHELLLRFPQFMNDTSKDKQTQKPLEEIFRQVIKQSSGQSKPSSGVPNPLLLIEEDIWKVGEEGEVLGKQAEIDQRKRATIGASPLVYMFVKELDKQMEKILEDVDSSGIFERVSDKMARLKDRPMVKKQDVKELKGHFQEVCYETLSSLFKKLDDTLVKIFNEHTNLHPKSLPILEILFIGRLCNAIPILSNTLKLIFSSKAVSLFHPRSTIFSHFDVSPLIDDSFEAKLRACARRPSLRAHLLWAKAFVQESHLLNTLITNLHKSDWRDPSRRKSWVSIKIQPSDSHQGVHEEHIPSQPSPYIMEFFYSISEELQRIGGHFIDQVVIQYIVTEYAALVLNHFSKFIKECEESIKESLLQFWFDVRYFCDVTQGALTSDPFLVEIFSDLKNNEKSMKELMLAVKSKLDPVDVLFYEKHVINQANEFYKSTYLLFGLITKNNPKNIESSKMASNPNNVTNVMTLIPSVPRFKLLPILEPNDSQDLALELTNEPNSTPFDKTQPEIQTSGSSVIKNSLWGTLEGLWGSKV